MIDFQTDRFAIGLFLEWHKVFDHFYDQNCNFLVKKFDPDRIRGKKSIMDRHCDFLDGWTFLRIDRRIAV